MNSSKRHAFTLIELLVVIAIIAILAAILFPVFAQAKYAAKKTTDLSNIKQITTGLMMYTNDNDDMQPLSRIVQPGDWWTPRMISWKDVTGPYVKSGERPYNNGAAYTKAGDGGIWKSSVNDAAWSDLTPIYWGWGPAPGPGDDTSRFPRGYALNGSAGQNENGIDKGIIGQWQENKITGSPGSATILENAANTIWIANSRVYFTDTTVEYLRYMCTPNGIPAGGQQTSCIAGTKNRATNLAFFDGHAKNVSAGATIGQDMWGIVKARETSEPGWTQNFMNDLNGIPEWSKGL